MSGCSSAAAPEVLEDFVRTIRTIMERERAVLRRLAAALDAVGPARRELGPAADTSTQGLRMLLAATETIAGDVASTAMAFWAADQVLARLGGGSWVGPAGGGDGIVLPGSDVTFEWQWPPGWSLGGQWGSRTGWAEAEVGAGLRVEAGAGAQVSPDAIRLGAFTETRLGAWAQAAVGSAIGPLAVRAGGEVFAGALARGEALFELGRDGAQVAVGGEVFAGGRAEGELRGGIGPVQAAAEGSVSYGIGATAQADVDLTLDRIGGRVQFGATLGLGFDVSFEYYVEPKWLADGLLDLGDELFDVGGAALDVGGAAFDAGLEFGGDALGTGLEAGRDALETGTDLVGGTLSTAGEFMEAGGGTLKKIGGLFS
jgi:hypothetical protein